MPPHRDATHRMSAHTVPASCAPSSATRRARARTIARANGAEHSRRAVLAMPALVSALSTVPASRAMFNADLDKPIEDGPRAIAVALAAQAALQDILTQNNFFATTCEAPVFACDLSQLNVKTGSRVSGPLRRSLPTLSEVYGVDPYASGDILQNVSTLEAIFSASLRCDVFFGARDAMV